MRSNKFSQRPLQNNDKSEGIDTNETDSSLNPPSYPLINTLNRFERNEALKQLASQISRVCSSSSYSSDEELMAFPLEDLPNTLQLLAELAIEAKANDTNREEKSKILHLAAVMLRRVLHMPEANHYRALGLDSGSTATQIAEHYRLLHELFWFDGTIDPQQKSRLRIFEAYTALKEPESRHRYDEEQSTLLEQQAGSSSGRSGLWRVAAVALPVILGLSVFMFYFEKKPDTEIAISQKKSPDSYSVTNENSEAGKNYITETPIEKSVLTDTIQQRPTKPSDAIFLPEEVPEVYLPREKIPAPERTRITEIQADDHLPQPNFIPEPPLDMVSTKEPYITEPERVIPRIKESVQVEQAERQYSPVVASLPERYSSSRPAIEAEPASVPHIVDAELLTIKPSLEASLPKVVPDRIKEPPQTRPTEQQVSSIAPSKKPASKPATTTEPGIVVIASPSLKVNHLTKKQLENIFLGKTTVLPNGQEIEIFDQQDGNAIKRNFYKTVTKKTPMQAKAYWAKLQFIGLSHRGGPVRPPEVLMNDQMIKERVATSKSAIGYISQASLDNSVKVLHRL